MYTSLVHPCPKLLPVGALMSTVPHIPRSHRWTALLFFFVSLTLVLQTIFIIPSAHAVPAQSTFIGIDQQGYHLYLSPNFRNRHIAQTVDDAIGIFMARPNHVTHNTVTGTLQLTAAAEHNAYRCFEPIEWNAADRRNPETDGADFRADCAYEADSFDVRDRENPHGVDTPGILVAVAVHEADDQNISEADPGHRIGRPVPTAVLYHLSGYLRGI